MGLDKMIAAAENGAAAMLGSKKGGVSGGEKQNIAIMRQERRQERRARSNERALLLYRGYALDLALAKDKEDTGDAGRDSRGDCRVEYPVAGLL